MMHLQLNKLEVKNKDYQKVILGLEERMQVVSIFIDAV
jgi:hypothetical protein